MEKKMEDMKVLLDIEETPWEDMSYQGKYYFAKKAGEACGLDAGFFPSLVVEAAEGLSRGADPRQMGMLMEAAAQGEIRPSDVSVLTGFLGRHAVRDDVLEILIANAGDFLKQEALMTAARFGFDAGLLRRLETLGADEAFELAFMDPKDPESVEILSGLDAAQIRALKYGMPEPRRLRILADPGLSPGYMKALKRAMEAYALEPFELRKLAAGAFTEKTPDLFGRAKRALGLEKAVRILEAGYSPGGTEALLEAAPRIAGKELDALLGKEEAEMLRAIERAA